MKICWDNLENFRYSKRTGKWYNGVGGGYVERDGCKNCGEPFLSRENGSDFCCRSCGNSGKYNPMFGKHHTEKTKNIFRKSIKKSQKTIKEKYGVDNISQTDFVKQKKGQFIINEKNVRRKLLKEGFHLLSLDGDNKMAKMFVECPNKHKVIIRWVQWKKKHRCVECYYQRLRDSGIQDVEGYELYKRKVDQYTKISYRRYKNIINLNNVRRGKKLNHLDHKYSKAEGFKNGILPIIIGSYINLEILPFMENCSKQERCSITKEELFDEYNRQIKFI